MFSSVTHFSLHLDLITSLSSSNGREIQAVTSLSLSLSLAGLTLKLGRSSPQSFIHNQAAGSVPCEMSYSLLTILYRHISYSMDWRFLKRLLVFVI